MSETRIPVLWLSGPSGVGKTAVAWKIYADLTETGTNAAYVDIDQLGMCYPEPSLDPGRYSMKERNAQAVVDNFRDVGAQGVVISGVIDPVHGLRTEAFRDQTVTLCWLAATAGDLRKRLEARGTRQEEIDTAIRKAKGVDPSRGADIMVDTSGLSVGEVARIVRQQTAGWPGLTTQGDAPSTKHRSPTIASDGPVLFLCGATGVGKSSVGFAVYLKTLRTGSMTAYIDVDQLAFFGGRANHGLRARNLASVWSIYREAGALGLVAVANIKDESATKVYEDALPGATFTWCRLHAGRERLTERILQRGHGQGSWPEPGDSLRGQPTAALLQIARESGTDADVLEHWSLGARVDTDRRSVDEGANAVLEQTRWLENYARE